MARCWVFVGTSGGSSRGIYRFWFDAGSGKVGPVELAAETANPSFLAAHPNGQFLYAVNAVSDFGPEKTGAVSAFSLDPESGELAPLNQQSSGGSGPCHVVVDRAGKNALVANYGGGSVAVLPIEEDGYLFPPTAFVQHSGSSVNPRRQEAPHAHSINLSPDERFAVAADLGLDQVLVYRFDGSNGTLEPNDPPAASTPAGAGPRHFAFHPSGRFGYVINELDSTVTAFRYNAEAGVLHPIQNVTTLPEGFSGENYPAEILVHPNGRFVYGSNRGHDSLAIFRVEESTGELTPEGHQASGGKWPRNFNFDPSGEWIVVGNQNSENVLIFPVDDDSGTMEQVGDALACPSPICFKFAG